MKKTLLLSLGWVVLIVLLSEQVFAQTPHCMRTGMGISGASYYSSTPLFKDVFKMSGDFWAYDDGWGGDPFPTENLDENGYPLKIPYEIEGIDHYARKMLSSGSMMRPGDYILLYEGEGTITFGGGFNKGATTVDGNTTRVECTVTGTGNIWMQIIESDPNDNGNYIRNIRIVMAEYESDYATNPFFPPYVDLLKDFYAIRLMDLHKTNDHADNGAQINQTKSDFDQAAYDQWLDFIEWDSRNTMTYNTQTKGGRGVAYEYGIMLCNQTKRHAWLCLPHNASDDYVRQLAQLYYNNLDPDLDVYLEYSNEIWNSQFRQYHWIYHKDMYPGLGHPQQCAQRAKEMWEIFMEEFGRDAERIHRVAATQTANPWIGNQWMNYLKDRGGFDHLATTWYFGISGDRGFEGIDGNCDCDGVDGNENPGSRFDRSNVSGNWDSLLTAYDNHTHGFDGMFTDDEFYDDYNNNLTYPGKANEQTTDMIVHLARKTWEEGHDTRQENYENAKAIGATIICYEGGTHIIHSGKPHGADGKCYNGLLGYLYAAEQSPQMKQLHKDVIDDLKNSYEADLVMAFVLDGKPGMYGHWGHINSVYDDPTEPTRANKYQALIEKNEVCDVFNQAGDSIGAGLALRFDGRDDYLDASSALSSIPDEAMDDYTVEFWFQCLQTGYEQSLFAFSNTTDANDNSSMLKMTADDLLVWHVGNQGTATAELKADTIEQDRWYHVAMVKRGDRYTLYLNGANRADKVKSTVSTSRNAATFGGWQTESGLQIPFRGEIDEIRIWNKGIDNITSLRNYMCRKLSDNHPDYSDLALYYRLDKTDYNSGTGETGTVVYGQFNLPNAQIVNFTHQDRSRYLTSGAAIGDTSKQIYPTDWAGISLNLYSLDGDFIGVSGLGGGSPDGVHLYAINRDPNNTYAPPYYSGLAVDETDGRYYGVFVANGDEPTYDVVYSYHGNPLISSDESTHRLVRRAHNADNEWLHAGAQRDEIANTLTVNCRESIRAEYILGFRDSEEIDLSGPGNAIYFDGVDDQVRIFPLLRPDDDYTLEFWARPENGSTMACFQSQTQGKRTYLQPSYLRNQDHQVFLYKPEPDDRPWPTREWQHFALVKYNGITNVYINGLKVYQVGESDEYGDGDGDIVFTEDIGMQQLYLGCRSGNESFFKGWMDEVRLWKRALSQEELQSWMTKKITPEHPYECADLLYHCNFDVSVGTAVVEDSRGASDAEIDGATIITSSAPLGDDNAVVYNESSTPTSLSLTHAEGDQLTATLASERDGCKGIHLYRIDHHAPTGNLPNSPENIVTKDSTRYWGIWLAAGFSYNWDNKELAQYDLTYHYEDNSAIANENALRPLYRRMIEVGTAADAPIENWELKSGYTSDLTANTTTISDVVSGEFVLGGTSSDCFHQIGVPGTPLKYEEVTAWPDELCPNETNLTLSVWQTEGAVAYRWELPAGMNGVSSDSTISITTESGAGGEVKVYAVNQYGDESETPLIHTIDILPAPTLADAGVDQNILTSTATMSANSFNLSNGEIGIWSQVGGASATISSLNNPATTITGLSGGVYTFRWEIKIDGSDCPTSTDDVVITFGPEPEELSGAQQVCTGNSLTYEVIPAEDVTADAYRFTLPDGLTSSGSSTIETTSTSIMVDVASGTGGTMTVEAKYGSYYSDPVSKSISIYETPAQPGSISGPDEVCYGHLPDYSIAAVPHADSYEWSYSSNWQPNPFPASTTTEIGLKVNDGAPANSLIQVRGISDQCGAGDWQSLSVTVGSAPAQPYGKTINGGDNRDVCKYTDVTLAVFDDTDMDAYLWTVPGDWDHPGGAEIINGQSTHEIVVNMGDAGGIHNFEVRAVKGTGVCSVSEPLYINIWSRYSATSPTQITPDDGSAEVASGSQESFTTDNVGAQYVWTLPANVTSGGQSNTDTTTSNSITLDFDATFTAGFLKVSVISSQGCKSKDEAELYVYNDGAVPATPVLNTTASNPGRSDENSYVVCEFDNGTDNPIREYVLEANPAATGISWTYNGSPILNANTTFVDGVGTLSLDAGNDISASGTLRAVAYNANGNSDPLDISVIRLTNSANTVLSWATVPTDDVCEGETFFYSVNHITGEQYMWGKDPDANIGGPNTGERESGYDFTFGDADGWIQAKPVGCIIGAPSWGNPAWTNGVKHDFTLGTTPDLTGATAPTEVCQGSESETFSVTDNPEFTHYEWENPFGTLIVGADNEAQFTLDFDQLAVGSYTIRARGYKCGPSNWTDFPVDVVSNNLSISFVSGNQEVCQGTSGEVYTVTEIPNATYTWQLPTGASITAGDNSHQVTIDWGTATNGQLYVYAEKCGTSNNLSIPVEIHRYPLAKPSAITGPTSVCPGNSYTYQINPVDGADQYNWYSGTDLLSGTTSLIELLLPMSVTELTVEAENSCGVSPRSDALVLDASAPCDLTWDGSESNDWFTAGNWSPEYIPDSDDQVFVPDVLTNPVINGLVTAETKNLTIEAAGQLTVNPLASLTVAGDLSIDPAGQLILETPANSGLNGSLITQGSVSGEITVKRFLQAYGWHYVSTPISGLNSQVFSNRTPNVYLYDETQSWEAGWQKIAHSSPLSLNAGQGYALYTHYTTINFTGTPHNEDQSVDVTYNTVESSTHDGWNLVGNPFPSAIDWDQVPKDNIESTVYLYDADLGHGTTSLDNYCYYIPGGGSAPYGLSVNGGPQLIAPQQGFFVRAKSSVGSSGLPLVFPQTARVHASGGLFLKKGEKPVDLLRLSVQADGPMDETVIRFLSDATANYDGHCDAVKFFSNSNDMPQLYSLTDKGQVMAINSLHNEAMTDAQVKLGFRTGKAGVYNLNIEQLILDNQVAVTIEDRGVTPRRYIDARQESSYQFTAEAGSDDDRFMLYFGSLSSNEDSNMSDLIKVYAHKQAIYVDFRGLTYEDAQIIIYDLPGKKLYQQNVNSQLTRIVLDQASGLYVVSVKGKHGKQTNKISLF